MCIRVEVEGTLASDVSGMTFVGEVLASDVSLGGIPSGVMAFDKSTAASATF